MNNTVDKTKLSSYNLILAFLVVLIHTENTADFPSLGDGSALSSFIMGFEKLLSGNIALIAVPSFFMISGILFYRDFTVDKYFQKLKSRVFSLIIPFLLWNFLRFALFYVIGKLGITESFFKAPRLLCTAENFFEAIFFYKYNLGFWFMYQLILFTLLSPVIRLLIKNKWVGACTIIGLFVLYATDIIGPFLVITAKKRLILLDCLIYYTTGAYISTHFFDIINKKTKTTKILAVAGVIAGQILNVIFARTGILIIYIMFLIVSSVSFWYLFDIFNVRRLPKCLAGITFFIYAAHGTVLEFLRQGVLYIGDTPLIALFSYILLPIITMLILTGCSVLMKKYTAPLWKILCGAR